MTCSLSLILVVWQPGIHYDMRWKLNRKNASRYWTTKRDGGAHLLVICVLLTYLYDACLSGVFVYVFLLHVFLHLLLYFATCHLIICMIIVLTFSLFGIEAICSLPCWHPWLYASALVLQTCAHVIDSFRSDRLNYEYPVLTQWHPCLNSITLRGGQIDSICIHQTKSTTHHPVTPWLLLRSWPCWYCCWCTTGIHFFNWRYSIEAAVYPCAKKQPQCET